VDVSPAEVARQIAREGKRHGLFPLMENGRCFVAQKERFVFDGPLFSMVSEELTSICSVNANAPLSNVWKSRKAREDFDSVQVYQQANLRRKMAERVALEERHRERVKELKRVERLYGVDEVKAAFAEARARGLMRMGRT
jgi:hypothetical protein